jgi:hypothetical protein
VDSKGIERSTGPIFESKSKSKSKRKRRRKRKRRGGGAPLYYTHTVLE